MMKFRHGDNFGRASGSTWRLLFVFALMPWLRKYRIIEKNERPKIAEEADGMWQPIEKRKRDLEKENVLLKEELAALKAKVV